MAKNTKLYYVKHQVHPDSSDTATKTILKGLKTNIYVYIPFKVTHFIYDNETIRNTCGVFLITDIENPLSIVSEMTLVKSRSKSGFNKLTLTLSKVDDKDTNTIILKRATLIFSKEYYTPELAKKIAALKTVNYEKNKSWTIVAITGPKEQFKLKIAEPVKDSPSPTNNNEKTVKIKKQ